MNVMTQTNLQSAYGGESMARTRYNIWADQAKKEGFANVARLFLATADAEKVHATLHFKALKETTGAFAVTSEAGFGLGDTAANLQGAIEGETFEFTQMYPSYIAVAEMQGESAAIRAFKHAIEAEKVHAQLFARALEAVRAGKDLEADRIEMCPVCGFVEIDGDDERCPLCGAKRAVFAAS